jgi:glutamyl-tRNA synthetase
LQGFLTSKGLKMGQLGPGLRAALFGTTQTPSLDLVLAALGREETLNRLSKSLAS